MLSKAVRVQNKNLVNSAVSSSLFFASSLAPVLTRDMFHRDYRRQPSRDHLTPALIQAFSTKL